MGSAYDPRSLIAGKSNKVICKRVDQIIAESSPIEEQSEFHMECSTTMFYTSAMTHNVSQEHDSLSSYMGHKFGHSQRTIWAKLYQKYQTAIERQKMHTSLSDKKQNDWVRSITKQMARDVKE